MEENLQDIIKGCRRDDRKSQHELYKLYYAYGMSVGIRYVKDEDEAILVLNDSFMKVFTRVSKYDSQYSFKPWFRKIVVNTAIDYIKKQKNLHMKSHIDDAKNIMEALVEGRCQAYLTKPISRARLEEHLRQLKLIENVS